MELNEAKKLINDVGYKYCSLWKDGECLESWNNQYMLISDKLIQIEKRLKVQPPGNYVLKCRNSSRSKIDSFEVNNGTTTGSTTLSETKTMEVNPKLLENQKILELSIENANLSKEVEYLTIEIEELENKLAEFQAQAVLSEEEAKPTLMENAQSFLTTLMEYGTPLLNQHWELKKQQMEIDRMKYGMRNAPKPNAPDPEKVKIRIIGEFVEGFKDNEEIYNALHDISANSDSVDKFLQLLNDYNPGLYEQLSIQL
jgi:hypothetical protein